MMLAALLSLFAVPVVIRFTRILFKWLFRGRNVDLSGLLGNVIGFEEESFRSRHRLFGKLGDSRGPRALFVSYSSSHVSPGVVAKALPNRLFVVHGVTGVTPPCQISSRCLTAASTVRCTILTLNIRGVVVYNRSGYNNYTTYLCPRNGLSSLPRAHG